MSICLIMAMMEEAKPIIQKFSMKEIPSPTKRKLTQKFYQSKDFPLFHLILNGDAPNYEGVSKVGTQAAAVSAHIAIENFNASFIINAGTAGGFKSRGSSIGDLYLCDKAYYHDRRVPITEDWQSFAEGAYPLFLKESWYKQYPLKKSSVSSGNSLDYVEKDLEQIAKFNAAVKEMEAASIAEICQEAGVPFTAVKSITDIVDGPHATVEEFVKNLQIASENLAEFLKVFLVQEILYLKNK